MSVPSKSAALAHAKIHASLSLSDMRAGCLHFDAFPFNAESPPDETKSKPDSSVGRNGL